MLQLFGLQIAILTLISACSVSSGIGLTDRGSSRADTMNIDDENRLPPELEAELRQYLEDNPPENYPNPMITPWEKYPHIQRTSIGWRMGYGEEYKTAFGDWFHQLSATDKQKYVAENPEPEEWIGYYDLIVERRNITK